jgi:hypothetical protein
VEDIVENHAKIQEKEEKFIVHIKNMAVEEEEEEILEEEDIPEEGK